MTAAQWHLKGMCSKLHEMSLLLILSSSPAADKISTMPKHFPPWDSSLKNTSYLFYNTYSISFQEKKRNTTFLYCMKCNPPMHTGHFWKNIYLIMIPLMKFCKMSLFLASDDLSCTAILFIKTPNYLNYTFCLFSKWEKKLNEAAAIC